MALGGWVAGSSFGRTVLGTVSTPCTQQCGSHTVSTTCPRGFKCCKGCSDDESPEVHCVPVGVNCPPIGRAASESAAGPFADDQ